MEKYQPQKAADQLAARLGGKKPPTEKLEGELAKQAPRRETEKKQNERRLADQKPKKKS